MEGTWVCLLPFLIVIPVSMLTKQVQPGLFVALLLGSYLAYPSLLGGIEHAIHYLISNIIVLNNIRIILFLYGFAGLLGIIKLTGGIKGFVHLVSKKVKTKRGAMFLTWISTLGTFSEPDFRIVTVAPIMKAMRNRLNMSKRRIGYAIEFTANPVIAIIPVATAFVGYMVSVIGQAIDAAGIEGEPYLIYVKSIPFNFFSFVIILVGVYYSFFKKPKKNEDAAFENAQNGGGKSEPVSGGTFKPSPGMQPANANAEMGEDMQPGGATGPNAGQQGNQPGAAGGVQNVSVSGSLSQAGMETNEPNPEDTEPTNVHIGSRDPAPNALPQAATPANVDAGGTTNVTDPGAANPGEAQTAVNSGGASQGMSASGAMQPINTNTEMGNDMTADIHGGSTGMYEKQTYAQQKEDEDLKKKDAGDNPHADQQEDLNESHRAYLKETPSRPLNLIIPIVLFILLTLFLSWWDGHQQATGFFNAFIKSDMLGVMLVSLLIAIIVALAMYIFQRFSVSKLATHFIKGGNELLNVIVMLSLIWAVTAVSEDLGFSRYITDHVSGWIPPTFVAPVIFVLGAIISYFIGSSWGTWGLLMPLGVTLAAQSGANLLLVIGAVFASGTFGAFTSPLSDNTVTLCTVLDLPVVKYARSKLVPASIAAGITTVLFGAAAFFL